MKKMNEHYHSHASEHNTLEHHHTVWEEILCHFPYAIFSVAISMIILSFLSAGSSFGADQVSISYRLFHSFHFLHLLFAATGTVLTFRRFSQNMGLGMLVGFFVPAFFCTISDAFLPCLGGRLVNLDMHFHWCFLSHLDTVLPFLIVGMINGWILSRHQPHNLKLFYSIGFHFFHIFISSMASILYLVSFGFAEWASRMGFVFLFLIFAVLVPCTLSDIVVPMFFARFKKARRK
jgi:hypothetical protein